MNLLFILAHPDDESYGPAGTISWCVDRGARVYLTTLTRGEAGTLGDARFLSRKELAKLRTKELECAAEVLNIFDLQIGDFPDGKLSEIPFDEGVAFVRKRIEEVKPGIIITFHKNGITGHPDHKTATKWTFAAFKASHSSARLIYYGVPPKYATLMPERHLQPMTESEITHEIDVSPFFEKKLEAIHCHKSQLEIYGKMKNLEVPYREIVAREYLSQVYPHPQNTQREEKLF